MLKALVCDIDGTLTDKRRRINVIAIDRLRRLIDREIEVVLASGNTICFMDAIARMVGTSGTVIGENGGAYRIGFDGAIRTFGDQKVCWDAFHVLESYFKDKGIELPLYSAKYRFSDIAFARIVDADEVRAVVKDFPIRVLDTGFAIHLQSLGFDKGTALTGVAHDIGLHPRDFLAIGDSMNDVEMLRSAGIGVAVANAHATAKETAAWVSEKPYGDGVIEAIERYESYFLTE
jgi:phosphoglycolate phosphatase